MVNKRIILFLVVFFIPLIIAQSIEVDYPNEVSLDEEFSFKIKLIDFDIDTYDVKIDILLNGDRIAKILNNDVWKSTYYYVNDIINENEEKEFSLKIIEDFDEADIVIKIKDSGEDYEIFTGYTIKKPYTSEEETNQSSSSDENESEDEEEEDEDSESEIIYISQKSNQESKNKVLNTINLNTEKNTEGLTKSDYALYGLGIFAVVIIVLFLLRKNKYQNEFR